MATPPQATQTSGKSKIVYNWVMLFMYNIDVEYPFSVYHVKDLEETEFPFHYVDGPLDDNARKEPFLLFSGQRYCLFSKIEQGMFFTMFVSFKF